MEIKYRSNLVCGIASLIFTVVLCLLIPSQIPMSSTTSYGVTSRTIPYGIAMIMGGCGIGLIIQSLIFKKDKVKTINIHGELPALLMFITFLAYMLVFEKEWPVSTALVGCISLFLAKSKKWQHYVIVVVLTIALYFIFVNILHIRLHSVIFGS